MAKPQIHPIGNNIVVQQSAAEETSAGGIILPDQAREKPRQGEVIAVGKGTVLPKGGFREPILKKGDQVLFGSYAGTKITVEGEEYLILNEDEVLAVFD